MRERTSKQLKDMADEQNVNYTKEKKQSGSKKNKDTRSDKKKTCKFCAETHKWGKSRCPAYGEKCTECGAMHHLAKACRSSTKPTDKKKTKHKRAHQLEETDQSSGEDTSEEDCFNLETVGAVHTGENKLMVTLNLQSSSGRSAELEREID